MSEALQRHEPRQEIHRRPDMEPVRLEAPMRLDVRPERRDRRRRGDGDDQELGPDAAGDAGAVRGATAAAHVVEHVEEWLQARREPGFRGEFAGQELRPGMERKMALNFLRRLGGVNPLGGGGQGPLVGGAGGAMGLGTPGLGGGMMPALGGPLAGATGFGGPGRTGVLLSPAELAGAMRGIRLGRPGSPPPKKRG